MEVGLRTRLGEIAGDALQQGGIRFFAARGEKIARLLTPAGREDPYRLYTSLRDEGPVVASDRFGVWLVTTHALNAAVVRDPRLGVDNRMADDYQADPGSPFSDHEMILRMDPPDHTRIRRLVGKAFTPRAVASWRPAVEKISNSLLDDVDPGGFDVVGDYAVPLTVKVICSLLGVPDDDWRRFREWGDAATRTLGINQSKADQRRADAAFNALAGYLRDLIVRRRSDLRDDLLSVMIAAEEEGDRLTDRELLANAVLLLLAGFETTVNLIGNGTVALLDHRDQWQALCEDLTRVPAGVEELLRYDSPVQFTGRVVKDDLELEGVHIPKGKQVMVLLASANNDPAVFTDPRRLDVGRDNAKEHLSFSSGAHYCLGASLARLEGEVAFGALLERFPDLHRSGKAVRRRADLLRGFERLPVAA